MHRDRNKHFPRIIQVSVQTKDDLRSMRYFRQWVDELHPQWIFGVRRILGLGSYGFSVFPGKESQIGS